VSFFDDEPDEPTRVTRPARPRRAAGGGGGAHVPPPDVARRRQFVLFGGLAVVALLLLLTVRSCAGTRHKNALKDYNREVTSIARSSDSEVSRRLFSVLSGGGQTSDVTVAVQEVRLSAEQNAKRAHALSPPDEVKPAQHDLELALNFRATGVEKIAAALPKALSNQPAAASAIRRVAGEMQLFLASDVVWSQRVTPLIAQALKDNSINDDVTTSKSLPSLGWLDATQVGNKINPSAGAGGSTASGEVKPGTHGHGIISVKAGAVALTPGGAVNHVPATAPLPVDVTYANQGQNDESNVLITVRITGGPKPITATKRLIQTKAGSQGTVTVSVPRVPPKSSATTMTVTVKPVPGEKKTDNNTQTYTVLFT
jgi:hypothetical protein